MAASVTGVKSPKSCRGFRASICGRPVATHLTLPRCNSGPRSPVESDPPTRPRDLDPGTRAALFAALMPEQSTDAPVAVGRMTGGQRLDLRDKLRLGLRTPSATLAVRCATVCATRMERATPRRPQHPLFWLRQLQRVAQGLVLQRLLTEQRCNSRICCCNARYSEAGTTSSPGPTADSAPLA
jgi:hypothetical protein